MGWSAHFEPWVVESWRQRLESIGYTPEVHKKRIDLHLAACSIANDKSLTANKRFKKIGDLYSNIDNK
jgi:hypothetical protein